MLSVDCVDGINIYYQMMEHIAQCVRDFSVRYIQYTPATIVKKLCAIDPTNAPLHVEREKKNIYMKWHIVSLSTWKDCFVTQIMKEIWKLSIMNFVWT